VRYGLVIVLVTQMLVLAIATQIAQPRAVRNTACEIEASGLSLPGTAITLAVWFIFKEKKALTAFFALETVV
jgi:hypothetical protein